MFSTKQKIEIDISEPRSGRSQSSSIRSIVADRVSKATFEPAETFLPIETEVPNEGSGKVGEEETCCAQLSRLKIESLSTGGVKLEAQRQRVDWILKNLTDKVKLIVSICTRCST